MRIWAIANQKGGVGKTTTTITLGGILADKGKKVLMLDLDPHGSLTSYFDCDPDSIEKSSYDLFVNENLSLSSIKSIIVETNQKNLSLLPASTALATLERQVSSKGGMGLAVSRALATLWEEYDYVLIDSPPVLGLLMINALAACQHLIIPVQTEFLALKGTERMMRTLRMINKARKKDLEFTIVPTLYDRRTQASIQSLRQLRSVYSDNIWHSMIPIDTKFRDASVEGVSVSKLDRNSRGVHAYTSLLKYLLDKNTQE